MARQLQIAGGVLPHAHSYQRCFVRDLKFCLLKRGEEAQQL